MNEKLVYPLSPYSSPGRDEFCYWENFLTEEDINYILSRKEWSNLKKAEIGGQTGKGIVEPVMRRTEVAWMWNEAGNEHIWEKITNAVWQANRQFFQFDLTGCYEAIQFGLYEEGDQGHYDWHTDGSLETNRVPRKLSIAILLDDPSSFEGGQLEVNASGKPFAVEQKKGRGWIFPAWTLHRVTPVTKGRRRSLVLWVGGPQFR
jgi:PKHD-type hydroxylase